MTLTTSTTTDATSVQDKLDQYWSGRATAYDAYQVGGERYALDRAAWADVWSSALPTAPADVLDVGTGSGYVATLLAGLGHRVTGLDSAAGMLERARDHADRLAGDDRPAPRFVRGDAVDPAATPEVEEGAFDAVVSRYVLWTLRDADVAVQRWIRLLRPGGLVACVDATWYPEGIHPEAGHGEEVETTEGPGAFARAYDAEVQAALPLAAARTMEDAADLFRAAGLEDVALTRLDALLELDERFGVAPGHEVRPQYLVTGRRP